MLKASRAEELTQEGLTRQLSLVAPPEQAPPEAAVPKKAPSGDPEELVVRRKGKRGRGSPMNECLHPSSSLARSPLCFRPPQPPWGPWGFSREGSWGG